MKSLRKIMALVIAMIMVVGMSVAVFAQTVGTAADGKGSITIENAAKGETYGLVKLFDATLTSDASGIAYKGDIPQSLKSIFEKDEAGNIHVQSGVTNDQVTNAVKAWAATQEANPSAVSDGSALTFAGLDYGYYAVKSSQGAAITINSTKPNATVVDKNSSQPTAKKETPTHSYSVGDTVTYTATFDAPNYLGDPTSANGAQQIVQYKITDTLPEFLKNVVVESVTIQQPTETAGQMSNTVLEGTWAFDENKTITIPWATKGDDNKYTSIYKAGSKIVVVYHATVTAAAKVGADNVNEVELHPYVDNGNGPEPYQTEERWKDDEKITTHAAALQKVDDNGANLAGAEFAFKGLTVTGEPGMYTVVSYNPNATENGTVMQCDANGKLVIGGINESITLVGTETKAPDGYNKMEGTFDLATIKMAESSTTTWGSKVTYFDAEGNVVDEQVDGGSSTTEKTYATIETIPTEKVVKVENNKGGVLPSTGGIGTTIFYIIGGILVAGAAIILIAKRRTNA